MHIAVIGQPDHEGIIAGRAFDVLQAHPHYFDPLAHEPEQIADCKPDVVLVSLEWKHPWRLAVANARRANIPVVYMMDGVLEWSYVWNNTSFVKPHGTVLQPLLSSHLSVIGRHPARILASAGLAEQIRVVGLPRLDDMAGRPFRSAPTTSRILVTTARTYGHNLEQKVMVARAIRDLKTWFAENTFVEPAWRISADLADIVDVEASVSEPIHSVLTEVDAVISFTSTVLLEAMQMRIPTAQIEYRAVPLYVQTAWDIRSPEQIAGVIHDLLHPQTERLAYQDYCLDDELASGCASERLAEVIREAACSRSSTHRRTSVGPVNGRLDFKQVHPQLSAFAISPLSTVQYELDAAYGYIETLRQRVTQRQHELDQRQHEFDQRQHECDQRLASASAELCRARAYAHEQKLRTLVARLEREGIGHASVYGAGEIGLVMLDLLRRAEITVVALTDSDPALWGRSVDGIPIVSPREAVSRPTGAFVIGSLSNVDPIRRRLHRLYASSDRPRPRFFAAR